MANIIFYVKQGSDSKNISCQVLNGQFSGINIKGSSSGSDPSAVNLNYSVCCRNLVATGISDLGLDPNNYSVHGFLMVEYGDPESSSGDYGGYILECFNTITNGVGLDVTTDCTMPVKNKPSDANFRTTFVGAVGGAGVFDNGYIESNVDKDLFEDSDHNWRDFIDGDIVATASQVENLPSGVKFNKWLVEDEIIEGSDGSYYDTSGNQMFSNLPSGVIPVSRVLPAQNNNPAVFVGSDSNYYDEDGNQVLDNLPSGVVPTDSPFEDVYYCDDGHYYDEDGNQTFSNLPSGVTLINNPASGVYGASNGNYYNNSGNQVLENLPEGVTITGSDGQGNYIGSDGNTYDIHGDDITGCDGILLQYSNVVRLMCDCEDIFGNQVTVGGDVQIGVTNSIFFPSGALIRKINRVVCRNLSSGASCGFGNIRVRGDIVGAKIGVDIEGADVDVVLGNYEICSCVFQACNQYADIVYNEDLPLGFDNLTGTDVGYFCLTSEFMLSFEGFDSSEFPYCCGSVDTHEKSGGELGKDNNKLDVDVECLCDNLEELNSKIDILNQKLDVLSCICDKFDSLISAINNKDLTVTVNPTVTPPDVSVTNNNPITVTPCQPDVIVNNIPVPAPQVTVNPTVTPPDVNVTNNNPITVTPCEPTIQNVINDGDVNLDISDLLDKLDELFLTSNSSGEDISITDVLKNKEMGSEVQVTVEPNELVNYRKVINLDDDN